MAKVNHYLARPYEDCLCRYLDETTFEAESWREIALSLMGYLSDDMVRDWAISDGYEDIFEEEDEEEDEDEVDDTDLEEEYSQYLVKWVAEHSGPAFAGMMPASYQEWLMNEHKESEEEDDE